MPVDFSAPSGMPVIAAWYAASTMACWAGMSFESVAWWAAAIAASVAGPRGAAFAASYAAVCTMAMTRTAGGVPSFAAAMTSPDFTFQSVMASAWALVAKA